MGREFPVVSKVEGLPYTGLTPSEFERLIRALVETDPGIEYCRPYGPGLGFRQQGIDLYARKKDTGEFIAYQCKDTRDLRPKKIEQAVKKFAEGEWADKVSEFILCTPDKLTSPKKTKTVVDQTAYLKKETGVRLIIWDGDYLNRELRPRVVIVSEFFPDWVNAFCPGFLELGDVRRVKFETIESLRNGTLYYYPDNLSGAIVEFRAEFERVSELEDNVKTSVNGALTYAKEQADRGDYDGAENALSVITPLTEKFTSAQKARYYNILCSVQISRENPEEALAFINLALVNDDCSKYKLNKIICLALMGDESSLATAGLLSEQIPENETDTPEYHYVLGILYFEIGDFVNAVKANERALELDNNYHKSRVNLTAGLLKLGDFDRCDQEFEILKGSLGGDNVPRDLIFYTYYGCGFRHLVEITSNRNLFRREPAEGKRLLGTITTDTLEFPPYIAETADKALNEFREARTHAWGLQRHYVSLNEQFCYILKGEIEHAKKVLLSIPIEELAGPLRRTVSLRLASVYLAVGEFDAANDICLKIVEEYENPKEELADEVKFVWAKALAGFGNKDMQVSRMERSRVELSIGLLLQLIDKNPRDVSFKNHLGIIYSYRGLKDKAEVLFSEIAISHPDDKRGLFNLGNHYGRIGEYRKAFLTYRRLQKLSGGDPDLFFAIPLAFGYHALTLDSKRKNRKYIAVSILGDYDRQEPNMNRKKGHLRILVDLYKQIAEIEDIPRRRNDYYDKAIAAINKISEKPDLATPILKSLEKERRFLAVKRTQIR
jgi:tetratricopeptide (TPR) repeat protein